MAIIEYLQNLTLRHYTAFGVYLLAFGYVLWLRIKSRNGEPQLKAPQNLQIQPLKLSDRYQLLLQHYRQRLSCFEPNTMPSAERTAFTLPSYILCLLFAFVYPVFFALINWLFSGNIAFGDVYLMRGSSLYDRWVILLSTVIFGVTLWRLSQARLTDSFLSRPTYWEGFVVAIVILVTVNEVSLNLITLCILLLIGFAVLFINIRLVLLRLSWFAALVVITTSGLLAALIGAVTMADEDAHLVALTATMLAIGYFWLDRNLSLLKAQDNQYKHNCKWWALALSLVLPVYVISIVLVGFKDAGFYYQPSLLLPCLMLGLLPFINGVADWLSFCLTRKLLGHLSESKTAGFNASLLVLANMLLSLLIAVAMMALTLLLLFGSNHLAQAIADKSLIDMQVLLSGKNSYWLYGMFATPVMVSLLPIGLFCYACCLGLSVKWAKVLAVVMFLLPSAVIGLVVTEVFRIVGVILI